MVQIVWYNLLNRGVLDESPLYRNGNNNERLTAASSERLCRLDVLRDRPFGLGPCGLCG
jgi:hypothetical protein